MTRWDDLERDTWPALFKRAHESGQDLDSPAGLWGRGGLSAATLEAAYWWADEQMPAGTSAPGVRGIAAEVQAIDQQIQSLAGELADMLRRKTEISESHGIGTDWPRPGLDLLYLVSAAVNRYPRYLYRVEGSMRHFVMQGHQTSEPGPDLADLLSLIRFGQPGPVCARGGADAAMLELPAGGTVSGASARVRRFFGAMDEKMMSDRLGNQLRPLVWLTPKGIATLLSVASGFDPADSPYQPEQVKKLRTRYLSEQADSQAG